MKITYDSFSAAYAKKWFKKNFPVFIATASFMDGKTLCEVHSMEKPTKALALADLKKELKGEGIKNMKQVLKRMKS